jgi:hypothetical protein
MGMDDSGLVAEMGPVVVSFQFDRAVKLEAIPAALPSGTAEFDARLGCTTLTDARHSLTVQIWPNGKCIVADARHPNMVAMAAVYWKGVFNDRGFFVDRI